MEIFRKLANSIFFKIILAFVALSFVLFGVSNFILGSPNTWVAKIGSDSISFNQFNNAMRADREVILASSGKSAEAMQYLESDRFKSDVLGRLVNQFMIKNLSADFGIEASKKIILESIAKDPSFRNEAGKFDRKKFEKFLQENGLNEERYVREIANGTEARMILQTFALASSAPVNEEILLKTESFKKEKRVADVITITTKDVANSVKPSEEEIEKFFKENQMQYALPERRKVSYLTFSKKDFTKDLQISDQEIFAEYEKNKELFTRPETRDIFNVVFTEENDAKNFLAKFEEAIKADKSKAKNEFEKLAKTLAKKDPKEIALKNVSEKGLVPQIAEPLFKLSLGDHSQVITSPLGFHVFLVNEIKKPQLVPFSEVKNNLKSKMAEGREEKILQEKVTAIDDLLLTSNSLNEVAKKFGLKLSQEAAVIDQTGKDSPALAGFAANAFSLKEKQASKILAAEGDQGYYALFVEEIIPAKQRELSEVKGQVIADVTESKKREAVRELAKKVEDAVKKNPDAIAKIASEFKVKFDKAQEFPRVIYLSFQGQQLPYQDQFMKDLFAAKIGEATPAAAQADDRFVIGVLRNVKKSSLDKNQFEQLKSQAQEEFREEMMRDYNSYLLARYPVATNDKIFGKPSAEGK